MSAFTKYLREMYVLDFLHYSTSPKTPEEIADGQIYSKDEIEETCINLLHDGLVSTDHMEVYKSNEKTKERIDDDIFERIKNSYETYLERFAESGFISVQVGEDEETSPYPLKNSIAEEPESFQANYFEDLYIGVEDDFYLTKENTLPEITDLSTRNLERLPILLTKLLRVSVNEDMKEYWRLTHNKFRELYDGTDPEFRSVSLSIDLLFYLILSSSEAPPIYSKLDNSEKNHSHEVLSNTNFIAAFVAYPTLEAYIKYQCIDDIGMDGTVKEDETVQDFSPHNDRDFYEKGDICSSLRDLLIHFEQEIADDQLQEELEQLRTEISSLTDHPKKLVYGLLYQWRNTLSHQATADAKFGVITNILCIAIWNDINKQNSQ